MNTSQPEKVDPAREAYDASNPDHVRDAKKLAEVRNDALQAGLKHLLSSPSGRAWLYDLLDFCGVFRSDLIFTAEIYARAGQRNVGLKIMAQIHSQGFEEMYLVMCREAKERGLKGFRSKALKDIDKESTNAQ